MNSLKSQAGVGLMEVLVALLILAIGILGFVALQLRAADASNEASDRTFAINIARDLAERMRVNRTALAEYKLRVNAKSGQTGCLGSANTYKPICSATAMASADAKEITDKASNWGHTLRIDKCAGSNLNCVYVAWGNTDIRTNIDSCINSSTGAYKVGAKCLVMEAF